MKKNNNIFEILSFEKIVKKLSVKLNHFHTMILRLIKGNQHFLVFINSSLVSNGLLSEWKGDLNGNKT